MGIWFVFIVGWLLGFMSQTLLMFISVPGIKMLLIYIAMYLCIAGFFVTNAHALSKRINGWEVPRSGEELRRRRKT